MVRDFRKNIFMIFVFLISILLSIAIIKYSKRFHYIYVCLLWIIVSSIAFVYSKKERNQLIVLYFGSCVLAFGVVEAYYIGLFSFGAWKANLYTEIEAIKGGHVQGDKLLGYKAFKNSIINAKRYYGDTLVYDVRVHNNQYGWRITPQVPTLTNSAVLFLGGSFTFGAGVNDEETLPFQFQLATQHKFKSFNFGYGGYGPHHMLALLEHEKEKDVISGYEPVAAVYQAIPHHVHRVAGKIKYSFIDPKYEIRKDGNILYQGAYHNFWIGNFLRMLSKSYTLNKVFFDKRKITKEDFELYAAVVKELERVYLERYGGTFKVLLWDVSLALQSQKLEVDLYENIRSKLTKLEIDLIEIKQILPDYHQENPEYFIPYDGHPSAKAYQKTAEYLSEKINDNLSHGF